MRLPFITRSRHARELAEARRQGQVAAIANAQRDIVRIWERLRETYGEDAVRSMHSAFYAEQFSSVPIRYKTGGGR